MFIPLTNISRILNDKNQNNLDQDLDLDEWLILIDELLTEGFESLGGPVQLAGWPHPLKQYSSRSKVNMDDDKIKEFCNITGAGAQVAEQLLQVCNGNLEMAINMHMEGRLHKS